MTATTMTTGRERCTRLRAVWRLIAVVIALFFGAETAAAQGESGYVGLQIRPVTFNDMQAMHLPTMNGVVVENVLPDGPGEKAGFKTGDVILEYLGAKIMGHTHMISLAKISRPGDTITAKVFRDGEQMDLSMVATTKPQIAKIDQETKEIDGLGATVGETSQALNSYLNILHNVPGLAVTGVAEDSPAARAAISQGDVITAIGQTPVTTIAELEAAYAQAQKDDPSRVIVRMMRGKDRVIAVVTPNK